MVPDSPTITRRRLFGGAAAALTGTVVTGATAPTLLPDVLTDQATQYYPSPPGDVWNPTVTDAHAREAVERLAAVTERGRTYWNRLDTDDRYTGAGGWLDDAREALGNGNHREALTDATYGMQFAAGDLGRARARLGEADPEALRERGRRIAERADRVVADIGDYPVEDPGRDLGWYYRIERNVLFARFDVDRFVPDESEGAGDDRAGGDGSGTDDEESEESPQPDRIGDMWAALVQGTQRVRNAERYAALLGERLGPDTVAYRDHLESVHDRFVSAIETFPSAGELRSRFEDREQSPYTYARTRLVRWCFDTDYRPGRERTEDLLSFRTVESSTALAGRRAHDDAVDRLVVDPDDEGFDSGHALAEKRRAMSTFRSVVGSDPPPLLAVVTRRAVEDIQVSEVGFADSYRRPLWQERLTAYCYSLVGRAKLEASPPLFEEIRDR